MRTDRPQFLRAAPLSDLLAILLRQHRRLLAERGISLTEARIQALAQQMADRALPDDAAAICEALASIVAESMGTLAGWNLTFAESLRTDMNAMPGWETTSEFLEIANEKGNAELRIVSGAVLLAALDDLRYTGELLAAIAHDPDELETIAGRRVLSQASGLAPDAPDWPERIRAWWQGQNP